MSVERFQCIEAADVSFGPGLNVLFGPNDLGKTSLAWAIRAALLLQHNSAAHERFVSWHGGGEPRVSLTLTDDEDRYWKVTKTFGAGTLGRSLLETSKDGRSFTRDAEGRGVDEKLRTLLNWGLHKPGGRGAPHGMPASFVTQVLLSDQDDVRKILFESSLDQDEEESGRQRLTQALGALAQDPTFKAILEHAQEAVDRAFTKTKKPKRSAGSPFVDIAKRLEGLQQQRDDLVAKARETALAEERIATLNIERDRVALERESGREVLGRLTAALATQARRDALLEELQHARGNVERAASLGEQVKNALQRLEQRETQLGKCSAAIQKQRAELRDLEPVLVTRRGALDELRRATEDAAVAALLDRQGKLREREAQAVLRLETSTRALADATGIAKAFGDQVAAVRTTASAAEDATQRHEIARAAEQREVAALEAAKERLREVTSGDHVRARELRMKQLENRRLELDADRTRLEVMLQGALAVERLVGAVAAQQATYDKGAAQLQALREQLADARAELGRRDEALGLLTRMQRFADLHDARQQLEAAERTNRSIARERETAARLRDEAAALRASVLDVVPDHAAIDALAALRTQLQVAEARLGAVSVAIRPTRPLLVTVSRDGVEEARREVREPATLSANRSVVVSIDGVAELEISGGDDAARATVAELHARWRRDGVATLQACGVDTVEKLTQLRRDTDRLLADIATRERDATTAEEAAGRMQLQDLEKLARTTAALEAELGADLEALAARHTELGPTARQTIMSRGQKLNAERAAVATAEQTLRDQVVRGEAELAGVLRALELAQRELEAQETALGESWSNVRDRARAAQAEVDAERKAVEEGIGELGGLQGADEAEARAAITTREAAYEAAKTSVATAERAARAAQDAHLTARATLDATRTRARDVDVYSAWGTALDGAASALDLAAWHAEVADATAAVDRCKGELADVRADLETKARERTEAIDGAQLAVDEIEGSIRTLRSAIDKAIADEGLLREELEAMRSELAEQRIELAKIDIAVAQKRVRDVEDELAALPVAAERYEPAQQAHVEAAVAALENRLRDLDEELGRARGGLEQVGGAVVRGDLHEIEQALAAAREQQRQIEVEYEAWQLLVEALRASESVESQHLGRQLAGPVSHRFQQLTGGYYGSIELDANLATHGLQASGGLREIKALSAGTQDQLATLLRLCIAEQLKSSIVLDDHLSQSDPTRISWFNDALRAAATGLQIIFITCRPHELLFPTEVPGDGEATRVASGGLTHAIDLTRLIRRFARAPRVGSAP